MERAPASSNEWTEYYERADRRRLGGEEDPFTRHVRRETARQRALLVASALFMTTMFTTWWLVLGQ